MRRKTVKTIAFIIIIALVVTSFSFIFFLPGISFGAEIVAQTTAQDQKYLNEKVKELENFIKLIHENYKDEVDYKTLMNGAFEGAMYSLDDPYSVFFVDSAEGQAFIESSTGEYEGIGVGIGAVGDGRCEVTSVAKGGPADKAGIKIGDLIVKVDGQNVTGKAVSEISSMLKGKSGTVVKVTVKRGDNEQEFSLTRGVINTTSVLYEMLEDNIGYIEIMGFTKSGFTEFKNAKSELIKSGAKSLIIDVRDNPGGLIGAALDIADELIESGYLVHLMQKGKIIESTRAVDKKITKMPTVLLVNENSASASEILAGALKDNKAAVLVGTTTFGKGAAQYYDETKDGYPFKLSVYYFLTPNKDVIDAVGIKPDYVVRNGAGEFREEAAKAYMLFAPFAEKVKPVSGNTGLTVFAAQQRLAMLGYKVSLTAVMDEATVSAVKQFQKENGLYAGGNLDFTTQGKIDEATLLYISGESDDDLQLAKAIELLKKGGR